MPCIIPGCPRHAGRMARARLPAAWVTTPRPQPPRVNAQSHAQRCTARDGGQALFTECPSKGELSTDCSVPPPWRQSTVRYRMLVRKHTRASACSVENYSSTTSSRPAGQVHTSTSYSTRSRISATPANSQRAEGDLLFSCALNTYVGPRISVLYTGHE